MALSKIVIFTVVSLPIIWVSWPSFTNRRSHGFYRFFAFESILILVLVNVDYWFREPFAVHQIVSWLLLAGSLYLAIHGFYLLRVVGKPDGPIENTTVIVTLGAYRYIRHPIYSSLLVGGWGLFFKHPDLIGGLLALVVTVSVFATARAEEKELVQKFGAEYAAYMKKTRMFVPFLI